MRIYPAPEKRGTRTERNLPRRKKKEREQKGRGTHTHTHARGSCGASSISNSAQQQQNPPHAWGPVRGPALELERRLRRLLLFVAGCWVPVCFLFLFLFDPFFFPAPAALTREACGHHRTSQNLLKPKLKRKTESKLGCVHNKRACALDIDTRKSRAPRAAQKKGAAAEAKIHHHVTHPHQKLNQP